MKSGVVTGALGDAVNGGIDCAQVPPGVLVGQGYKAGLPVQVGPRRAQFGRARYALCLAGANLGSMSERRAAMLLIVTDDGRLLLHHRDDKPGIAHPGCWAGFGGAVEEGEPVEEALRREVLEETGLVIEEPRLLTEAVDVEGGGRLVSLFYIRGSFSPEQIELHEGAGVGVHSLEELDDLDVTPFVRRAINSHLVPLIRG